MRLFITGWGQYFAIFFTYFGTLSLPAKLLAIILMLILIAVPILAIVLLVRAVRLRRKLKGDKEDNAELYREIGKLNRQVLNLIDEKNKILALKVSSIGGVECSAIQLCGSLAAVAVYLGFSAVTGSIELPSAAMLAHLNVPAALCIGLVNTGLGCYMYFSSMGELPVTRVAVCGYLEPLSAVVLSALLLDEAMTPANVLGAALILGGAIYSELGEKLRRQPHGHRVAARALLKPTIIAAIVPGCHIRALLVLRHAASGISF